MANEAAVARLTRKLRILDTMSLMLTYVSVWLFAWGIAVLCLRAALSEVNSRFMLLPLAGALPVVWLAVLRTARRANDPAAVRALLDEQNRCGGLLMAAASTELGTWGELMPRVTLPRLHWRGGRRVAMLAVALLFLAGSFLVPVRFAGGSLGERLDVGEQVERLSDEISALKAADVIDDLRVESLNEELDSIQSESSGTDPARTWEALDHLEQSLSATALDGAQKLAKGAEDLGKSKSLAEALAEGNSGLDGRLATEAMKELSRMAEAAAAASAGIGEILNQNLLDGLEAGSLSSGQLKELAAALGKRRDDIARRIRKLYDAKLIDLVSLKKCEGACKDGGEGLAAFLVENGENISVEEMMQVWANGAVTRGRADAPMTWTEGSNEQGAKFKEQTITPSAIAGFNDSQLVGRSVGAPVVEKGKSSQAGALRSASSGGGSAVTRPILPRHKGAVKRYFDR